MNKTSIAWVRNFDGSQGYTWNPFVGCKVVSPGCAHCYAARLAGTRLAHLPQYAGLVTRKREVETTMHSRNSASLKLVESVGHWTGEVRFFPEKLDEPLRLRKPTSIFVGDMGDLFHDGLTNEQIASVFGVMAACPQHTFHVLTKRAERMRAWFEWVQGNPAKRLGDAVADAWEFSEEFGAFVQNYVGGWASWRNQHDGNPLNGTVKRWPLANVRVGVTVENQAAASERIPLLLQTPASVRFLSMEPLLEAVRIDDIDNHQGGSLKPLVGLNWVLTSRGLELSPKEVGPKIDWVIVGGESGPRACRCNIEWIRDIIGQCRQAGVPVFVKQIGARATIEAEGHATGRFFHLNDRAGADPTEWPEDLRVHEFPKAPEAA